MRRNENRDIFIINQTYYDIENYKRSLNELPIINFNINIYTNLQGFHLQRDKNSTLSNK